MYSAGIDNRPGQNKEFQNRLSLFSLLIVFSILFLIIFITKIQVIQNIKYKKHSTKIREKEINIPPIRGNIYSSDQIILAENLSTFNIFVSPNELYSNNELRQKELLFLSKTLNVNYNDIEKKINDKIKSKEDLLIAENISFKTLSQVVENLDKLPGVNYKENLYRYYANNDLLSHVIGYTGPINSNELALKQKEGYEQSDNIGVCGIEKEYEKYLRGQPGKKVYSIDARMIIQNELKEKEIKPLPGNELILSVNFMLQKNVEEILSDRVGTILVMKPSTGEVLALASYPNFNPNIYILNSEDNFVNRKAISLDTRDTPLLNRSIQSLYPAASIFKIISSVALLNENVLSPYDRFYCTGYFRLGLDSFKCWVYPGGHGSENLTEGIKNSCDVYFYNVALKVGPKRIKDYAAIFGFGNILGIDIPYEKNGLIPSPAWLKEKGETWYEGNTLNTAIGQGDVTVTPLQIANFFSIICNKGYSYKPHIVKEIRSSIDGSTIKKIEPEKIFELKEITPSVFDFIHDALRKVVTEGTARLSYINNKLKIAGKTGTAEVGKAPNKETHSWFVGYGPIDYPLNEQIVVVTLIEYENNDFLRFAAPIAGMVFNSWFNNEDFHQSASRLWYPIKDSYNKSINNKVK